MRGGILALRFDIIEFFRRRGSGGSRAHFFIELLESGGRGTGSLASRDRGGVGGPLVRARGYDCDISGYAPRLSIPSVRERRL